MQQKKILNNVKIWQDKYLNKNIGWDLGKVSPPLKAFFDTLKNKKIKILIPGAGNAYEAEYLYHLGFENIYVVEWAPKAVENLKNRLPQFPTNHIIEGDFFKINDKFDLIVEQTFFCALDPSWRKQYVTQMKSLLKNDGLFVGLLFNREFNSGPPFGGSLKEYQSLFGLDFKIIKMEPAYNSIAPRQGTELFFMMKID